MSFVYFIQATNNKVKIGKTKSLGKRFYAIEAMSPIELDLIIAIKTDDADKLERHFHNKFNDKRSHYEWFDLTDQDIEYIKYWCNKNEKEICIDIVPRNKLPYINTIKRNNKILEYRERGWTLQSIGNKYGITRERVNQIIGELQPGLKLKLAKLGPSKLFSFMIEGYSLEQIREEANRRKISVSQLIRDSIDFYRKFTKVNEA